MRRHIERKCSLWWCYDRHYAHGLCERHYLNVTRYGSAVSPKSRDVRKLVTRCEKMAILIALLADGYIHDDECDVCHGYMGHEPNCSVGEALELARDTLQAWEDEREIA